MDISLLEILFVDFGSIIIFPPKSVGSLHPPINREMQRVQSNKICLIDIVINAKLRIKYRISYGLECNCNAIQDV